MRANEYTERLKNYRSRLVEYIKRMVGPHLYVSGFRNRAGSQIRLYTFFGAKRQVLYKKRGEFKFCAVASTGVVTDAWGGGCVLVPFQQMYLEDLIFVAEVLEKWNFDREHAANER